MYRYAIYLYIWYNRHRWDGENIEIREYKYQENVVARTLVAFIITFKSQRCDKLHIIKSFIRTAKINVYCQCVYCVINLYQLRLYVLSISGLLRHTSGVIHQEATTKYDDGIVSF